MAAGLLVPASALATIPIPLGFWKAPTNGSAGPTVLPSDFTGLQVWYRSSDLSLNDGDPVSTWTDRSSNANNSTASGTTRPTFKTNIIGSTPVLRFDGSDDGLIIGTTLSYGTNPTFTVMALLKPSASGGVYCGNNGGAYMYLPNTILNYNDTATSDNSDTLGGSLTDFCLFTVRRNSPNVIYRQNKTARGTHNIGVTGYSLNRVGRFSGGALYNGDYIEFMAWSQSLSDADCDSLYDNYFKVLYPTLP